MNNFIKYGYVIFEDENKNVCVIRDTLERKCVFSGMGGKIKEVKRGFFTEKEYKDANCSFIKALINKKKEYLLGM
ncbi:UNVERIFIED_ORG: hypothetical protein B2H93_04855 [Clostridium botulinum]